VCFVLTFFDYLRRRAYESIVRGVQEALEFLEKNESSVPPGSLAQIKSAAANTQLNNKNIEAETSLAETPLLESPAASGRPVLAPRRRGRPRNSERPS
jgi:hypothetical protein